MKLFELKKWELHVSEEVWGFPVFKKILDRDKTKDKKIALLEMLFIYHFADIKSDYQTKNKEDRIIIIKKDLNLPINWKVDKVIEDAITFYIEHSETVIEKLYRASIASANAISEYLNNTGALLVERDKMGKPVNNINVIVSTLKNIKIIMRDLKDAYNEVLVERTSNSKKKKGSQEFNIFEDGLEFDE